MPGQVLGECGRRIAGRDACPTQMGGYPPQRGVSAMPWTWRTSRQSAGSVESRRAFRKHRYTGANTVFQSVGGTRMPPPAWSGHTGLHNAKQGALVWRAAQRRSTHRIMRLALDRELPGHSGMLLDGGGRMLPVAVGHACAPHPTPTGGAAVDDKRPPPAASAGSCRDCCTSTSSRAYQSIGCVPWR